MAVGDRGATSVHNNTAQSVLAFEPVHQWCRAILPTQVGPAIPGGLSRMFKDIGTQGMLSPKESSISCVRSVGLWPLWAAKSQWALAEGASNVSCIIIKKSTNNQLSDPIDLCLCVRVL
jgi:hypothetical protein